MTRRTRLIWREVAAFIGAMALALAAFAAVTSITYN